MIPVGDPSRVWLERGQAVLEDLASVRRSPNSMTAARPNPDASARNGLLSAYLEVNVDFTLPLIQTARYWRITETLAFSSIPCGSSME